MANFYFFDLKATINELKSAEPREHVNFAYLVAFILMRKFWTLADTAVGFETSTKRDFLPVFFAAVVITGITYALLKHLYNLNGGYRGKFFLDRLLAIGWIANVRFSMGIIPLLIAMWTVNKTAKAGLLNLYGMIALGGLTLLAMLALAIFCYRLMTQAFREVARNTSASATLPPA